MLHITLYVEGDIGFGPHILPNNLECFQARMTVHYPRLEDNVDC
jgi:hypothetical protein